MESLEIVEGTIVAVVSRKEVSELVLLLRKNHRNKMLNGVCVFLLLIATGTLSND